MNFNLGGVTAVGLLVAFLSLVATITTSVSAFFLVKFAATVQTIERDLAWHHTRLVRLEDKLDLGPPSRGTAG